MEKPERIIKAARIIDHLERQMSVAGIIATELAKKGTHVVMVGGSAVELYTQANYMTRDIDFIAARPDGIKEVMSELGFKNDGGTWYLPDNPNIVVEFPAGPLDGSWDKTLNISLPDGNHVKVIGIEDIIIDRASAVKHWNDPEEWTNYLITGNYARIDWEYLEQRAKELDCTEIIHKSREWAKAKRLSFAAEQIK